MQINPLLSEPKLLFTQSDDSTRLMVGLSWEPKKVDHTDLLSSHFIIAFLYILSIILHTPKFIINFLLRRKFEFPQNTFAHKLYSAERKVKLDDAPDAKEAEYRLYDLDLSCYSFNADGDLQVISPDEKNIISKDGKIYHSGEDFTGQGVYDDETIYFNLKDLNDTATDFFIVVISDCKYDFGSLDNSPKIRIVDSQMEKNLLETNIDTKSNLAKGNYVYLYGNMKRTSNDWYFESFNQFFENEEGLLKAIKLKSSSK